MKVNDVLRNKVTGKYGTVVLSGFQSYFSVHSYNEEDNFLEKTLGQTQSEIEKDWEKVDLPVGYEISDIGGIKRIKKT